MNRHSLLLLLLCLVTLPPGKTSAQSTASGLLLSSDRRYSSGEPFHLYQLEVNIGDQLVVDLRSTAFDPHLVLASPLRESIENDDHEGSEKHSRITTTATEGGTWVVVVTASHARNTGEYSVSAKTQNGPVRLTRITAIHPSSLIPKKGGAYALDAITDAQLVVTSGDPKWDSGVRTLSSDTLGRRLIAVLASGNTVLWDLSTADVRWGGNRATEAVLLPDGEFAVTDDMTQGPLSAQRTVVRSVDSWQAQDTLDALATKLWNSGRRVAVASREEKVLVVDTAVAVLYSDGSDRVRFETTNKILSVALTPDRVVIQTSDSIEVWDRSGRMVSRFATRPADLDASSSRAVIAPTKRGDRLLTGGYGWLSLRELDSGKEIRRWSVEGGVTAIVPSADDRSVIVATNGFEDVSHVSRFEYETGQRVSHRTFVKDLRALAIVSEGRLVAAGSNSGTIDLMDLVDLRTLATLTFVADERNRWVVVTPEGRFDAGDLRALDGLGLVEGENRAEPIPLESVMRDRFQPRLVAIVAAGDSMPQLSPRPNQAILRPSSKIAAFKVAPDFQSVSVSVEVREERRGAMASGARDLQLFRNGRLVASQAERLDLDKDGSTRVTWPNILLPSGNAQREVTFTAAAFSDDGVRGVVASRTLSVPARPGSDSWNAPENRRAYVISMGVNDYSDPYWNLSYAARDARLFQQTLWSTITATNDFDAVVAVPLIAERGAADRTLATKAVLRGILALLAGAEIEPALRAQIPSADKLQKVGPRDLVVISISTHGYTAPNGIFYFLPEDVGPARNGGSVFDESLLSRAISSTELAQWLRPVDSEITLILDACHSAASVEGSDFRPGPFASPALGQLAYDKQMLVLTASQAADVALESGKLRQGLLSYVLLEEGLRQGLADFKPTDGSIQLSEWLAFGAARVPALHREVVTGEFKPANRGFGFSGARKGKQERFQRPAFFDFSVSPRFEAFDESVGNTEMARLAGADESVAGTAAREVVFRERDYDAVETANFGLSAWIRAVGLSGRRNALVLGAHSGELLFVEIPSGKIIGRRKSEQSSSIQMAVGIPETDRVAVINGFFPHLRVEDLRTNETIWEWQDPSDVFTSVAVSAGGALVAVGDRDGVVRLLDANTGVEKLRLRESGATVTALSFTADERFLVVAAEDATLLRLETATGSVVARSRSPIEVRALTPLPECCGMLLSTRETRELQIASWSGADSVPPERLQEYASARVAVSPDGRLAATFGTSNERAFVRVFELKSGRRLARLVASSSEIQGVEFSPDGKSLYGVDRAGRLMRWDVERTLAEVSSPE